MTVEEEIIHRRTEHQEQREALRLAQQLLCIAPAWIEE
jgi:hypothetical protein